ncbi:MAG: IS1595 family transposase [Rhodospirillaceae bacterium]|nr:IS1595 family transposase [Rhodospirillaceae bacterium]
MMVGLGSGKATRQGLSWPDLFARFPDDATAERWFEETRWGTAGQPSFCPKCGATTRLRPTPNRHPLPYWCPHCRRHFSVRTNTVLHKSRLPLQKWIVAIYIWSTSRKGASSLQLARDLGISPQAAWYLGQRLRTIWRDDWYHGATAPREPLFCGPVEVDETYVGGLERSKHLKHRLRAGRGAVGKTPVVGILDRPTNTIAADVVPRTDRPTLHNFIQQHVQPGAQVYTDNNRAYRELPNPHAWVNHSAGEYVRGNVHTNGIESFWAQLKRTYRGTHHYISPDHLPRYVAEMSARHNLRSQDTLDIMRAVAIRLLARRLTYADVRRAKR